MKKKQAIALLLATVLAGTGTVPYAFVSTVCRTRKCTGCTDKSQDRDA